LIYTYKTNGVCSRSITIDIEGDTVNEVRFEGGCSGNTQGVAALVKGMQADKVIELLKNIDCKGRGTSCPAQLAIALEQALSGAAPEAAAAQSDNN